MQTTNFFIYSNDDFAVKSAGTTRMIYYAKAIANESNKVFLVSCCQSKFSSEDFEEIEPNVFLLTNKKLVKYNFLKTLGFLRHLSRFSKAQGTNNIFLFYPDPLINLELLSVFYLKLIKRFPVFFELNEIRKHSSSFHDPLSFGNFKYSIKKIVFKSIFTLMEPMLMFYDGLICISTAIEGYGQRFNKKTLRIPILTDPEYSVSQSKKQYIKPTSFNVGFSGSISISKENLDLFLRVLKRVNENGHHVHFNFCGYGTPKNMTLLESLIDEGNLVNKTTYYGNLNETEFSSFLGQQDLLIIPRGYTIQNHYGFSTKLSDYLNHKRLILLTDISDNKLFIKDGENGFIVPPDNEDAMYTKLVEIIENFEAFEEKVLPNAVATSKTAFNYNNYKKPLTEFLLQSKESSVMEVLT